MAIAKGAAVLLATWRTLQLICQQQRSVYTYSTYYNKCPALVQCSVPFAAVPALEPFYPLLLLLRQSPLELLLTAAPPPLQELLHYCSH